MILFFIKIFLLALIIALLVFPYLNIDDRK